MATVGVFDSGVGGLSVLQYLVEQAPEHDYLYLADLARVPYGTKRAEHIIHYARQACQFLLKQGAEVIVIACNTISALALPMLQHEFDEVTIVGVIETSVEAVCHVAANASIAVLATEATIKSHIYANNIKAFCPSSKVISKACGVFVAIVEEGWVDNEVAKVVVQYYLQPLLKEQPSVSAIVLGCTHFSFLRGVIEQASTGITVVDSSVSCAQAALTKFAELGVSATANPKPCQLFVTDSKHRFIRVAKQLTPALVTANQVVVVNL